MKVAYSAVNSLSKTMTRCHHFAYSYHCQNGQSHLKVECLRYEEQQVTTELHTVFVAPLNWFCLQHIIAEMD
jgi:hypothetical protein